MANEPAEHGPLSHVNADDPLRWVKIFDALQIELYGGMTPPLIPDSMIMDVDSYARAMLDPDYQPQMIKTPSTTVPADVLRNFSMVHFLLRSTLMLGYEQTGDPHAALRGWSLGCLAEVKKYLRANDSVSLPKPAWADAVEFELLPRIADAQRRGLLIDVQITLDSRLTARSFPRDGRIEISAYSREYLRTLNLTLANVVMEIIDGPIDAEAAAEIDLTDNLLDLIFATYHRAVNFSGLPIPRFSSPMAAQIAVRCAHSQILFMLAHELGHIVEGHDRSGPAEEVRADRFAFDLLRSSQTDDGETFVAMRWLFHFLALEQIVTSELSGYPVADWADLPVRRRDEILYEGGLKDWRRTPMMSVVESVGAVLILDAKYRIRRLGPIWLRSRYDRFVRRFGTV